MGVVYNVFLATFCAIGAASSNTSVMFRKMLSS